MIEIPIVLLVFSTTIHALTAVFILGVAINAYLNSLR